MSKFLSISILSDLHLDMIRLFWCSEDVLKGRVVEFFDPIFKPNGISPADVLVISGDIGHNNSEGAKIIEILKNLYFEHIVCVLGNHDYYLIGPDQQKYKNSFDRAEDMRERLNSIDGVYCLNGSVVEIEGMKFGGCDSWYDGEYLQRNFNQAGSLKSDRAKKLWFSVMNDSRYIHGIQNFDEIWNIERPKILDVYQKCDIMITHVCPSIDPKHTHKTYRDFESSCFFTFDGEEFVKNTSARFWIYGHTHTPNEFKWRGVSLICNQLGYPGELACVVEKRILIPRRTVISPSAH